MLHTYPCVLQASLQSRRLPGKVLMQVWKGKTMLEMAAEAALRSERVSRLIVQMPDQAEEQELLQKVEAYSFQWTKTYQKPIEIIPNGKKKTPYNFAFMVGRGDFFRVTADCPLLDHRLFAVLGLDTVRGIGVASFTHRDGSWGNKYPDGWDIELIRGRALEGAKGDLQEMYRQAVTVAAEYPYTVKPEPGLAASVNTYHDLLWVRFLCESVSHPPRYEEVVEFYTNFRKQSEAWNDFLETSQEVESH